MQTTSYFKVLFYIFITPVISNTIVDDDEDSVTTMAGALSTSWQLQNDLTLPLERMMFTTNIIDHNFYTFGGLRVEDGNVVSVGQFEQNFNFFGNIDPSIYEAGWFVGQNEGLIWDKDPNGIYYACEDTQDTAKITRFEYETGLLQTITLLPLEFRSDDCCSILYKDSIYIFGGLSIDEIELDSVLIYNLNTGVFTEGTNMLYPRADQTCVYSNYNGENLVSIWGRSTGDDPNQDKYSSAQFYDLDNDIWSEYLWQDNFDFLPRSLLYPRVIWIPGTRFLLYTGGDLGTDVVDPDDPERYSRDIYIYSLKSNKFVFGNLFPSFVERRSGHSLVGTFDTVFSNKFFNKIYACLYAVGGLNFFDENAFLGWGFTDTTEKLCFNYWTLNF